MNQVVASQDWKGFSNQAIELQTALSACVAHGEALRYDLEIGAKGKA